MARTYLPKKRCPACKVFRCGSDFQKRKDGSRKRLCFRCDREKRAREYDPVAHFAEMDRRQRECLRRWRLKNRRKIKAQQMANKYIPIPPGCRCAKCGSTERIVRHHPDYSKPLEIVFLCTPCHNKAHKCL